MHLLALSASQPCVAKNQAQQMTFPYVFTSNKRLNDTLMSKDSNWLLRQAGYFFRRNQITNFRNFFVTSVRKVCNAMTFPGNVLVVQCFSDDNLLIAGILAELEKLF